MPPLTHPIGSSILQHLSTKSVFWRGHVVYCVEATPAWESVTMTISDATERLAGIFRPQAIERSCLLALRAVRDHPNVDPGSVGVGRIGYYPLCDGFWMGFMDSSTELLYIVMPQTCPDLERRSVYPPLIMSPLRLVGDPMRVPSTFPQGRESHPLMAQERGEQDHRGVRPPKETAPPTPS